MIRQLMAALVLGMFMAVGVGGASEDGDAILGLWATEKGENGQAHVEITEEGGKYHGKIVWLEIPNYPPDDPKGMGGQLKVDRMNPEEDLRQRPILGLVIVEGFEYFGGREWKNGQIYDPESGKTYKCKMRLTDESVLKVRGYIGFSLLGRTTEWTRLASK